MQTLTSIQRHLFIRPRPWKARLLTAGLAAAMALGLCLADAQAKPRAAAVAWKAEVLNDAQRAPVLRPGQAGPDVLRAQILLSRAWFSVGEMDGRFGANMGRVLRAYQQARELPVSGRVDAATWQALRAEHSGAVLQPYTVTEQDAAGPFVASIPSAMAERALLPAMGYTSLSEALAERFHLSEAALRRLNPGVALAAGATLQLPDIADTPPAKARSIEIDKSERVMRLLDAEGRTVAAFPVSFGNPVNDDLPLGEMAIKNEVSNPEYTFDPKLIKGADPAAAIVKIPPGPNNPVGSMWLGLSKPHWGIHGTPIPGNVGHGESNGCIHLTNWDAQRLSKLAKVGFKVSVKP